MAVSNLALYVIFSLCSCTPHQKKFHCFALLSVSSGVDLLFGLCSTVCLLNRDKTIRLFEFGDIDYLIKNLVCLDHQVSLTMMLFVLILLSLLTQQLTKFALDLTLQAVILV